MLKKRLIAVLILREGQVVQSVQFKHTNVIHYDAVHAIECFNKWAVDEIVILNVSPDRNSRGGFANTLERISRQCFVPISAGGWIDDSGYAEILLRSGADKLVINTAFFDNPDLALQLSRKYGSQCIVASMDVRAQSDMNGVRTVWVDRGRRNTCVEVVSWASKVEALGAGEIFFNSISHDGARKGYDLETLKAICSKVSIPVIAFGGVFNWEHLKQGLEAGADAVAAANIFHYTEHSTYKAKKFLLDASRHGQFHIRNI